MKKLFVFVFSVLLVAYLAAVIGCGASGGGGSAYSGSSSPSIFALFSWPTVYIYNNGSAQLGVNISNYLFTGEAVSNAVVIASNETTGLFTYCGYMGGGYYSSTTELKHGTGESVSLTAVITTETMKGGPTQTPDSQTFMTNPTISSNPTTTTNVTIPFTITWTTKAGNSPAAYTAVSIFSTNSVSPEGYMDLLPFTQTSFTVTSYMIRNKGVYGISVYPMNRMTFTGGASNSFGMVGSCLDSPYSFINIQ